MIAVTIKPGPASCGLAGAVLGVFWRSTVVSVDLTVVVCLGLMMGLGACLAWIWQVMPPGEP